MSAASLVSSANSAQQAQNQQVLTTQQKVWSAYLHAHQEITDALYYRITGKNPSLTTKQQIQIIQAINAALANLNKDIAKILAGSVALIVALIVKEIKWQFVSLGLKDFEPDIDKAPLVAAISRATNHIDSWNNQVAPDYLQTIQKQLVKGESKDDILKSIAVLSGYKEKIDVAGKTRIVPAVHPLARARTHAAVNVRYGLVFAANAGRLQSFEQAQDTLDKALDKMWMAMPRCCPSCQALNGQVVPLDSDFSWQVLNLKIRPYRGRLPHPPLHPNCRCRILPVVEGMKEQLNQTIGSYGEKVFL